MKTIFFLIMSVALLAGCGQKEEPAVAETQDASGASEAPATQSESTAASSETPASATQASESEGGAPSADPTEAAETSADGAVATSDSQESAAPITFVSATVNKKASVRAEASSSGDTVATLDKGASITVGSRSGIWYAAQSPAEGWIKITDVTIPNNGDGSSALAGLFSGRMGSGNSVASSGARGLTSEAVVTSTPDFAAVEELNALQNSGDSLGDDFFDDQEERNIGDSNG